MDQVAKFLGHGIHVHGEYYRLSENTLRFAKMSKLLLAIEQGASCYKGRSLDEMDLDDDREKDRRTEESPKSPFKIPPQNKKRAWSDEEKKAVWCHLRKYLILGRVPGKKACDLCRASEPKLKQRSWKDIKNFVHNSIQSKKKKILKHK